MKRLLAVLVLTACAQAAPDWKPVEGNLMTPWAAEVNPAHPLPEYPRPQMARSDWQNLNGLWEYAVVDKGAPRPEQFSGNILVPFPIESALSGVKRPLTPEQHLWYRRTFTHSNLNGGKRLLLHFGAVDWEATVFVNGKELGTHRGGYDAFSFDITGAIAHSGKNELAVRVWDPTDSISHARGKQNLKAMANPGGIWYTPASGIWQTVWLEQVPAASIESLKIVPDVDGGAVRLTAICHGATNLGIEATALDGSKWVARGKGKPGEPMTLRIPAAKLWWPENPFLYDLRVVLKKGNKNIDEVKSYFGMRKIALGKDEKGITRLMLNNKFVFQAGPLDQGFWPDGIYTAPTDEALRYDIEFEKKMGFNMARKHVKVEPDRWYYWCDKLGLLVWQDMPSHGAGKGANRDHEGTRISDELAVQWESELKTLISQHENHPSIVMWVVFNEGWGQYETARIAKWAKSLDPSRIINSASGWHDEKAGDVADMHKYPGPGSPPLEENRAAVLGEFGGLGFAVPDHTWVQKSWGYRSLPSLEELNTQYQGLWKAVQKLKDEGLSAAVYTQTTDVETECNGLVTYDRKVIKVKEGESR